MFRRIFLFLDFYSMFAAASCSISVVCGGLLYQLGLKTFSWLFWFKIITLGICAWGAYRQRGNRYYYYKNLGMSVPVLWGSSIALDLIIYGCIMTLIIKNL